MLKALVHSLVFVFLTLLTQIGGLAYLLYFVIRGRVPSHRFPKITNLLVFGLIYLSFSAGAALTAPLLGREPLPCFGAFTDSSIQMQSPLYCLLNRHYVSPRLKSLTFALADHVDARHPGSITLALDAGFPFIEGFPLLPHPSHDDGRKLDLAFYYKEPNGAYLPRVTKSPLGYWGFENPKNKANSACKKAAKTLSLRWNMEWFQLFVRHLELDRQRMATALKWLKNEGRKKGLSKILIEPHLARAFSISGGIVRFQGCRAARHDDHVHIQVSG